MIKLIPLIAIPLLICSIFSCNNDDTPASVITELGTDGLIDETERAIMNDCLNNNLNSVDEIENNLIGEWELVGFGHGWFAGTEQPTAYITIEKDELVYKYVDSSNDTEEAYFWEVEELISQIGNSYRLKIIDHSIEGLFINVFCNDYMYGDATPFDGNMYLYQKVR